MHSGSCFVTIAAFAAIAVAAVLGGWVAGLVVPISVVVAGACGGTSSRSRSRRNSRRRRMRSSRAIAGSSSSRTRPWRGRDSARGDREAPLPATTRTCSSSRPLSTRSSGTGSQTRTARAPRPETGLANSLSRLAADGIDARGEVGDADPVQSIADALRTFGADEVIISTHPEGRSNWLERGVVDTARERFAVPITHVVVDLEAQGLGPRLAQPGRRDDLARDDPPGLPHEHRRVRLLDPLRSAGRLSPRTTPATARGAGRTTSASTPTTRSSASSTSSRASSSSSSEACWR